jgi:hypothetical protein
VSKGAVTAKVKLKCIIDFNTNKVYSIKACADENIDRNYKNRNIYILSDSQAAIKALEKHQITSKLVWDCH